MLLTLPTRLVSFKFYLFFLFIFLNIKKEEKDLKKGVASKPHMKCIIHIIFENMLFGIEFESLGKWT
jgi:hypothetical protein